MNVTAIGTQSKIISGGYTANPGVLKTLVDAMPKGVNFDAMLKKTPGLEKLLLSFAKDGAIDGPSPGRPASPLELNYWGHSPLTLHSSSENKVFRDHIVFVWQKGATGSRLDFGNGDVESGAKLIAALRIGDLVDAGILKLRTVNGLEDAAVKDGIQFQAIIPMYGKPGDKITIGFANGPFVNGEPDLVGRGGGYMREYTVTATGDANKPAVYPIQGHGYERFEGDNLVAYKP